MDSNLLLETNIPGKKLFARGKVRDTYLIRNWREKCADPFYENVLLQITTDRISAFDAVMDEGVPESGKIRNQISLFWFSRLANICPNHVICSNQAACASAVDEEPDGPNNLAGRSVLVRKANVFPVELIVRGYISGSAWEKYQAGEDICGIKLPSGLRESDRLLQPIFTPTTKAKIGHDEPITFDRLVELLGPETAEILRENSIKLYIEAEKLASLRGIIIADTKFEFGMYNGKIILVDECLTPDSSRFWDSSAYKPGKSQPSFDKQPLRDWLKSTGWDKKPPPPRLPAGVIEDTRDRYAEAYERIVGKTWPNRFV